MHVFRHLTILLLLLAASAAAAAPLPGRSKPSPLTVTVQVTGADVAVTGLTASRPAAVMAFWRTKSYETSRVAYLWREGVADRDGALQVAFNEPLPPGALLLVIDVATGHVETVDIETQRFVRVAIPNSDFKRDSTGDVDELASSSESAAIVLIREGVGVWIQVGGDGGSTDHDEKTDGFLRTRPLGMTPVAGSPAPPAKIKKRDVVLVLDVPAALFGSTEVAE